MDNKIYMNNLLDFYVELLTKRQKEICELYFYNDYSLSEIADLLNVSRNAVFDSIKKSEASLIKYESILSLYKTYDLRSKYYNKIIDLGYKDVNKYIYKCIDTEKKEDI